MLKGFKYSRGIRFIDGWRDVRESKVGDCDDYAYSLARQESSNFLMFLFNCLILKTQLYWVYSSHSGLFPTHMALYTRGKGWACSTYPRYTKNFRHRFYIPFPFASFFLPWAIIRIITYYLYSVFGVLTYAFYVIGFSLFFLYFTDDIIVLFTKLYSYVNMFLN